MALRNHQIAAPRAQRMSAACPGRLSRFTSFPGWPGLPVTPVMQWPAMGKAEETMHTHA